MTFRSLVFSYSLLSFLTNGALMAMDEEMMDLENFEPITTQSKNVSENVLMEMDEEMMDLENSNSKNASSMELDRSQIENLPNEIQTLILQKVVYQ